MSYYPINLNLQDRAVLVVGGGNVAQSKTEQLIKTGARVFLVSPELTARLSAIVASGVIRYRRGEFSPDDLNAMMLVISATNCQTTNEMVAQAAAERGLLCNIVDQPA